MDEPIRKIDESLPAECGHCGEHMVWVDGLYLAHASTGLPTCAKDMTKAEREYLDRLYEDFKRQQTEDGGRWPETTGNGK